MQGCLDERHDLNRDRERDWRPAGFEEADDLLQQLSIDEPGVQRERADGLFPEHGQPVSRRTGADAADGADPPTFPAPHYHLAPRLEGTPDLAAARPHHRVEGLDTVDAVM